MDSADKKILEHQIAVPVGKAVSKWMKENGVTEPVAVNVMASTPSCYIDEQGISHSGPLIVCNVDIVDYEDDDEDDF